MICRGGERLAVMCGVKKKCKEEAQTCLFNGPATVHFSLHTCSGNAVAIIINKQFMHKCNINNFTKNLLAQPQSLMHMHNNGYMHMQQHAHRETSEISMQLNLLCVVLRMKIKGLKTLTA
ncbi:unnamed protein product [Ceratitis capitata]|uniref:(Mediterranean fruit fly) hypothetical protein n=1 Tax=Ceratitis capitata TaxID=7213 RepID=A0A811UAG6_CERCA|nr:unnamed protein product [Ceratitis capitata]